MRQVYTIEEVLVLLRELHAPEPLIEQVQEQAALRARYKNQRERDEVIVGSGYGRTSQRGHVELVVNDQLTQMDTKKAREIGLMLLEAAEAAESDEIMIGLLTQIGLTPEGQQRVLLDLRELRQGARGVSHPQ
jgi:hypothetical protein